MPAAAEGKGHPVFAIIWVRVNFVVYVGKQKDVGVARETIADAIRLQPVQQTKPTHHACEFKVEVICAHVLVHTSERMLTECLERWVHEDNLVSACSPLCKYSVD